MKPAIPSNVKTVAEHLSRLLPQGSYTVLQRNYAVGGDARNLHYEGSQPVHIIILLRRVGREAAVQNKAQLEALGYQVSSTGDLTLHNN